MSILIEFSIYIYIRTNLYQCQLIYLRVERELQCQEKFSGKVWENSRNFEKLNCWPTCKWHWQTGKCHLLLYRILNFYYLNCLQMQLIIQFIFSTDCEIILHCLTPKIYKIIFLCIILHIIWLFEFLKLRKKIFACNNNKI